jgi:LysR family glycine cleavage system transcriptional activator
MFALARAAERGAGIALIPMPVCQSWFESGALLRLFSRDLVSSDSYYVVAPEEGDYPEAAATLWQWIVDAFADGEECDSKAA